MWPAQLLSVVAPPLCWGCGGSVRRGDPLCRPCRLALRWLGPEPVAVAGVELWAPLAYDGPARALVGALKFKGADGVAGTMAAQIVASAPAGLLVNATLVPVPLHPARLRRRGFNQAQRLAAAIARRSGLPLSDCIVRRGPPTRQVGRLRGDRLSAVEGAVGVRPQALVPTRALLVDDVATTGATLRACTRVLARAGTRHLSALTYARTPGR